VGETSRFWTFSLTVYAAPGVQAECLDLQDRCGIDINLLLFCAYAGAAYGVLLSPAVLRNASAHVAGWHKDVVRSLRTARRALKPFATEQIPAAELRTALKAAELEAERIEQLMLETWNAPALADLPRAEPEAAIAANIGALFAASESPCRPQNLPTRIIAAALDASSAGRP
jgi:uncharacterized protein (TIGR02444 family)